MTDYAPAADVRGGSTDRVTAWLRTMIGSRDLTVPCAAAPEPVRRYVAAMREEMLEYRALIRSVAESVSRNTVQLHEVARTTDEQRSVVESMVAAISEVEAGAVHVSQTADTLRGLVGVVADTSAAYDDGSEDVAARLQEVVSSVEGVSDEVSQLRTSVSRIDTLLGQLDRLARQTQMLGVNAAIEAAYLSEQGSGFTIVADQVRTLGAEAGETGKRVRSVVRLLGEAMDSAGRTVGTAGRSIRAMIADLAAARKRANATSGVIPELRSATDAVAAIAAEQSAQLAAIVGAAEAISHYANELAAAARTAQELDLVSTVRELDVTIGRYTVGNEDGGTLAPIDGDPLAGVDPQIRASLGALRDQLDTDQREILSRVQRLAVAIARNSFAWGEIARLLDVLRREVDAATVAIDETIVGASHAGTAAQTMRSLLDVLHGGFLAALTSLEEALAQTAEVRGTVEAAGTHVERGAQAAREATEMFGSIDHISDNTTLLSLNAAIEAAHAGTAGSGFGVIAEEIRLLSVRTYASTGEIAAITSAVGATSTSMRGATAGAMHSMNEAAERTERMQALVGDLRAQLDRTLVETAETAAVVTQQVAALRDVREASAIARSRIESDSASAGDERRLELASLGERAHALAARRPLGTVAEQIRELAMEMAPSMDAAFDRAIDAGEISLEDCYDTAYRELRGADIARLGRLFDVSRVPAEGFDPPKYATRYDAAVDEGIDAVIDAWSQRHAAVASVFVVDLNGFCIGHARECRQAWTGRFTEDLNGNRIKRFFEDPLSLRCSRVGLSPAAMALPARSSYAALRDAGARLHRVGGRPWSIYTYARDTGKVYNSLSVAVFARDRRVATVRLIYDADVL